GAKLLSPPYAAAMECVPAVRLEVVKFACPFAPTAADPRRVPLSANVTVPVTTGPDRLLETLTGKVTAWPVAARFRDAVTATLRTSLTTTLTGEEWLATKLVSPL